MMRSETLKAKRAFILVSALPVEGNREPRFFKNSRNFAETFCRNSVASFRVSPHPETEFHIWVPPARKRGLGAGREVLLEVIAHLLQDAEDLRGADGRFHIRGGCVGLSFRKVSRPRSHMYRFFVIWTLGSTVFGS